MNDSKKILNFNFSEDRYNAESNHIINGATTRRIKENILMLNKIIERNKKQSESIFDNEIYHLFMKAAPLGFDALKKKFCSRRKIRKLANLLSYHEEDKKAIIDTSFLDITLELFENNFSKSLLEPLFRTLLKEWNHQNSKKIKELLKHQIGRIESKSKYYKKFVSNSEYFFPNSAVVSLCYALVEKNICLDKILDYLNFDNLSWICFDYFSEIAETYTQIICRSEKFEKLKDSVLAFLLLHQNEETNKKCLEKIINKINKKNPTDSVKQILINFCYKHIGDPSYDSNWYHWKNANQNDKENLKNAQSILNQWLAHKFINLFFEKIAMDKDRKVFWMKYIDHITNFKIFMEKYDRYRFMTSNRDIDADILYSKIGTLVLQGDTSAFILQIKEYYFVVFSQVGGACYIYHESNKFKPKLSSNTLFLDKLKHPTNRKLAINASYSVNPEGRIIQSGYWQSRFKAWIKYYLKIEV